MRDDPTAGTPRDAQKVLERFSANVIEARESAGLTPRQLAERSELHPVEVTRVERGETLPRLDTAIKLAGALDVRPAELCAGVSWDVERQRYE